MTGGTFAGARRSGVRVTSAEPHALVEANDNTLDDAWLLSRITQGDHDAFAQLVRRHAPRFFRVACRFTGNGTESEDIVQDAFLKIWERPDLWKSDRNTAFTTWFYRIVVNQCLDLAKKKRPVGLVDEQSIEDGRITQEQSMIEQERSTLVEREIARLPERQRTALNLCFYEELSNKEAAEIMGVGLKALQALLMRAKATLKNELKIFTGGT
ncbi:MAG: sigma-70 family RNA polymerase sigma factor [Candidatus Sungbacteria bacterium]|uniref:Sigma-70 family RNA polymerase sigma factor n=1 Tax=Candidatus Sungiibacteriota bacterium TaxID=2750080 RepID=A0A932QYD4_9BACT|nr:sigma-70 family RNA polymerase sigma factor [Candidatus Sungbacteria bacterium]